jgi:hypothetical protein
MAHRCCGKRWFCIPQLLGIGSTKANPETAPTRRDRLPSSGAEEPRPCAALPAARRLPKPVARGVVPPPDDQRNKRNRPAGLRCSHTTQHHGELRRSCSRVAAAGARFMSACEAGRRLLVASNRKRGRPAGSPSCFIPGAAYALLCRRHSGTSAAYIGTRRRNSREGWSCGSADTLSLALGGLVQFWQ